MIAERKMKIFWKEKLLTEIDPLFLTDQAPELNRPFDVWSFPNKTPTKEKTVSQVQKKQKS